MSETTIPPAAIASSAGDPSLAPAPVPPVVTDAGDDQTAPPETSPPEDTTDPTPPSDPVPVPDPVVEPAPAPVEPTPEPVPVEPDPEPTSASTSDSSSDSDTASGSQAGFPANYDPTTKLYLLLTYGVATLSSATPDNQGVAKAGPWSVTGILEGTQEFDSFHDAITHFMDNCNRISHNVEHAKRIGLWERLEELLGVNHGHVDTSN